MVTSPKKKRWPWMVGGGFALIALLTFIALSRLDAYLLTRARAEAQAFSQRLGRPIELADLSVRLFPNVGVEVEGVKVGAAPGEPLPLSELSHLEVSVALWPALRSRGEDIQVRSVEVAGLTVNVLRLQDGTTNLDQVMKRLEETAPPEESPTKEEAPTDLSRIRVDEASVKDALIRFRDLSHPQAKDLAISDLDVSVHDLRAGKPLEVLLKAAVLAPKQNVEMKLLTAELPPTLMPTPLSVSLDVQPVDLTPLSPFFPPSVGLASGTFEAHWKAELGAAVPGGEGPTQLVGLIKAHGLRFAEAEGSEPLDLLLDADVQGDAVKGDLDLKKLRFDVGPAGITGKGRVLGLRSPTPKVEGLEILGHDLDPAVLARYHPGLATALKGQAEGPVGLSVRGEGTQAAQSLRMDLDFTPVRLRIPQTLSKDPGQVLRLTTQLQGAAASGGALRFTTSLEGTGLDLRPGGTFNKAPGQRLEASAQGSYLPPPSEKQPLKVELSSFALHMLADTLKGQASFEQAGVGKAQSTSVKLAVQGDKLDADALLIESTDEATPPPAEPADPQRFKGLRAHVDLQLAQLRYKKADYHKVRVRLKMVDDAVTLETFSTAVYGGEVSADGTQVWLGPAKMPFKAKLQMRNVDLNGAIASFTPHKILSGRFNGEVALQGAGFSLDDLSQSLAGELGGQLLDGQFLGTDVIAEITGPLAKALPFAAKALPDEKVTSLGKDLPFGLTIAQGAAQLSKPLKISRPEASLSFEGGVKLNGDLALRGNVGLAPAVIARLTANKVALKEPLPVGLQLTGPAWKPAITGLDLKPAVNTLVKQAAVGMAGQLLGEKGKQVQDVIEGGKVAATARAEEEKARAEAAARAEAEKARKRTEAEAKKRLKGIFGR